MRATRRLTIPPHRGGVRPILALPLAAAALWVALSLMGSPGAPGGAGKADESFASYFTCFASAAPFADAQTGRPGRNRDRRGDCLVCQASCCGAAPIAARPGSVGAAPVQRKTLLRWMVADCAAPTPRSRPSHRPRAPPADPA